MSADPNPCHCLGRQFAKGAIVISDANAKAILATLQTAEMERRMMRVPTPQLVILDRELLNLWRQGVEEIPEPPGRDGLHFRGGHSRRSSFADSLSASSNRKSSLPAEESRSIWSSQRPCSRTRNHWTMRRYSSGVN